ncbi:MAG: Uma2 family endonuclease [Thermodesulfatator sp.]|nr:MAG: Uma2 family endonuclease [Thermodesulfatator sp.]
MTQPVRKEKEYFTYDDYLQWKDGRWQIIDGVVYDMSPAPSREHQRIVLELAVKIHAQLQEGPCEVYMAPFDVRLPDSEGAKNNEILTVVQPDIVVVCDEDKLDDRGCLGAPDLVVEVLSPSTAVLDLKEKRELYERHGVKEYWLAHPADRLLMVYRPDENGCYQKAAVFGGTDIIESSAVAGIQFSLEDIFGKAPSKQPQPFTQEPAHKQP